MCLVSIRDFEAAALGCSDVPARLGKNWLGLDEVRFRLEVFRFGQQNLFGQGLRHTMKQKK